MLYLRNYVKSGCAKAGFHWIRGNCNSAVSYNLFTPYATQSHMTGYVCQVAHISPFFIALRYCRGRRRVGERLVSRDFLFCHRSGNWLLPIPLPPFPQRKSVVTRLPGLHGAAETWQSRECKTDLALSFIRGCWACLTWVWHGDHTLLSCRYEARVTFFWGVMVTLVWSGFDVAFFGWETNLTRVGRSFIEGARRM